MMTAEGEKWALEKAGGSFVFESQEAEFWLRAFIAEVRSRKHSGTPLYALGEAFEEVSRELIGDER